MNQSLHRRGDPVKITVITHDLATIVLSMTKAKELIKKTWDRMLPEAERLVRDRDFVSATPTMEFLLTDYGTPWMYANIKKIASDELQSGGMPSKQPEGTAELYTE